MALIVKQSINTPLSTIFEPGFHENMGRKTINKAVMMVSQPGAWAWNRVVFYASLLRIVGRRYGARTLDDRVSFPKE